MHRQSQAPSLSTGLNDKLALQNCLLLVRVVGRLLPGGISGWGIGYQRSFLIGQKSP
jgi:hypothetical protein